MERAAEPDPIRANFDNSSFCKSRFKALVADRARAAKPDADEARPAAVGKLLVLTMEAGERLAQPI